MRISNRTYQPFVLHNPSCQIMSSHLKRVQMMPQYLILPKLIPHLLTFPLQPLLFGHTVPIAILALSIPFFDSLVRPPFLRWGGGRFPPFRGGGADSGSGSGRRRNHGVGTTQFLLGDALLDELFERLRIFGCLLQHVPIGIVVFPGFIFEGGVFHIVMGLFGIVVGFIVVVLVVGVAAFAFHELEEI